MQLPDEIITSLESAGVKYIPYVPLLLFVLVEYLNAVLMNAPGETEARAKRRREGLDQARFDSIHHDRIADTGFATRRTYLLGIEEFQMHG